MLSSKRMDREGHQWMSLAWSESVQYFRFVSVAGQCYTHMESLVFFFLDRVGQKGLLTRSI